MLFRRGVTDPELIKTYLTHKEIQAMADNTPYLRDKLIIHFFWDTGGRSSELLKVKLKHVDLKNGLVLMPDRKYGIRKRCPQCNRAAISSYVYCSHCGCVLTAAIYEEIVERGRRIEIGPELLELLRQYIEGGSMKQSEEYLIGLTRQRVYDIVRELAESIGLKGRVMVNRKTGKHHFIHPDNIRDSAALAKLMGSVKPVRKHRFSRRTVPQIEKFVDYAKTSADQVEKTIWPSIPFEKQNMAVSQLDLSVRTLNSLRRGSITTLGELISKGEKELMILRNFGQRSLQELQERLKELSSNKG